MKKKILGLGMLFIAVSLVCSCGNSGDKKAGAQKNLTPSGTNAGTLPNYRFIDTDSVMLKYNLSIDFNEQMIRMQNNLNDEEKRQSNIIQSRANALQTKMNAAQSQSDVDALKSEYQSLQNLQNQAQQKLAQMSMDMESTLAANAQTVMDSLSNFLRDYAAERGYEAVFVKNCAPFYNPALDVTAEVVKGLNDRYNKVNN